MVFSGTRDSPGCPGHPVLDSVQGGKQVQNLPEVFHHRVWAVLVGELDRVLLLRGGEDDVAAHARFLRAGDVPLDVVRHGDALAQRLRRAVATLPEKQRLVFNMKYYDDMKYEDISEILGTSVGALKASYYVAIKKIEQFFSNTD